MGCSAALRRGQVTATLGEALGAALGEALGAALGEALGAALGGRRVRRWVGACLRCAARRWPGVPGAWPRLVTADAWGARNKKAPMGCFPVGALFLKIFAVRGLGHVMHAMEAVRVPS